MVIDQAERKGKHRVVAQYMLESLNTHNIWTIKIFIAEIIYFLNVLGNIYLIDVFLGVDIDDFLICIKSPPPQAESSAPMVCRWPA